MTDTIPMDDALRLKRSINVCVEALIEEGFAPLFIGTVMTAVGAAMVKASGRPGDIEKVVDGLRDATADVRKSNLQ